MPRLSVLLPAFDAAATIDRAVRSTLGDLPADAELVVADDGSTDGTLEVLGRIHDPRLRIVSAPNQGVSATLAMLLRTTDSEIVARMDADDIVLPGRFARQLHALDHGADLSFTTVVGLDERGVVRPPAPTGISPDAFPLRLLLGNPVAHSTMTGRRALIEHAGGYRPVPSEDYDLWMRVALHGGRLARLRVPAVVYRRHAGQVTAAPDWPHSSWQDPSTQQAYAELSRMLLGAPFSRITSLALAPVSRAHKLAQFADFERRVRAAALPLGPWQRRAVRRRLDERGAWLWRQMMAREWAAVGEDASRTAPGGGEPAAGADGVTR